MRSNSALCRDVRQSSNGHGFPINRFNRNIRPCSVMEDTLPNRLDLVADLGPGFQATVTALLRPTCAVPFR